MANPTNQPAAQKEEGRTKDSSRRRWAVLLWIGMVFLVANQQKTEVATLRRLNQDGDSLGKQMFSLETELKDLRKSVSSAIKDIEKEPSQNLETMEEVFAQQSKEQEEHQKQELTTLIGDKFDQEHQDKFDQEHREQELEKKEAEPTSANGAASESLPNNATKLTMAFPETRQPKEQEEHRKQELTTLIGDKLDQEHQEQELERKETEPTPANDVASESLPRRAFPETRFTPHVQEVLSTMESTTLSETSKRAYNPLNAHACEGHRIVVDEPYSPPSKIECGNNKQGHWCKFFQDLFRNQTLILPHTVAIGTSSSDFDSARAHSWGSCIASSAPMGQMSMNNFQDAMAQTNYKVTRATGKEMVNVGKNGWTFKHSLPWEKRQKVPVFRGHPRMVGIRGWKKKHQKLEHCTNFVENQEEGRSYHDNRRVRAAAFSLNNPELLDAVVTAQEDAFCAQFNATNGLDRIFRWGKYSHNTTGLPPVNIPASEYYTNYQSVLVLGGIGAAFRTARHMAAGQTVILQDWTEEWYVHYLTPYVHYIPLKRDLSDMKEVMEWVLEHPKEVEQIAQNGKAFYWKYLSFPDNNEHWYELIWRLSELLNQKGPERAKQVWPANKKPFLYERTPNGDFSKVEDTAGV